MELVFNRVTKQYRNKKAVDDISMALTTGVYGLLGANGAGKTTLMRMMCGVLRPDSGEIRWDGIKVEEEKYRDILGYLPQEFGYYPDFTAMDFLMYLASLKGISKKRAKERAERLLHLVSLEEMAGQKIKIFSGGMKQRLGIAQSLLNNPKVLVLDEPTAGLDPKERVKFRNLISKLGNDRIVMLSTHIVSDIEHIADTILLMKDGKMIHGGSLEEIVKVIEGNVWECRVENDLVKKFMEDYLVLNVRQEKQKTFLRLICKEKPLETAEKVNATLEDLYLYYFNDKEEGSSEEEGR